MYQFLKTHFSFLMCFLVILMGCTNRKVSREFSDTMKDGSRVVIKIEYKPKSVMNSKGEKFGSYYFIAKHFFRTGKNAEAKPVIKKNPGKEIETEPAPVPDDPIQKFLDEYPGKDVGPAPPPKIEFVRTDEFTPEGMPSLSENDDPYSQLVEEFKQTPAPQAPGYPAPMPKPIIPMTQSRTPQEFVKEEFVRIYISFYDREGHLLLQGFTPDGYAINFANHEKNTFDGGVEWKGQFDEGIITIENFRDIHSITVQSRYYTNSN